MTLYLTLGIFSAIGLILILGAVNGLAEHRSRVRAAWSEMDEQLRRRAGLLSLLPSTDESLIAAVRAARNHAAVAVNHDQLAGAERDLSTAVTAVLANHPGSAPELIDSETRITQARRRYNTAVADYNNAVHSFPGMLVATAMGFTPMTEF